MVVKMVKEAPILLVFVEGILTFVSPCMLPMIPLYIAYMAGGDVEGKSSFQRMAGTMGFVLGFTVIFVLMGMTATTLGHLLKDYREYLERVGGVLLVIFGLFYAGVLKIPLLSRERRMDLYVNGRGFLVSLLFGVIFSLGWTPCIGPFLGSVLWMAGLSETLMQGALLLFVYSLGLGIPFILTGLMLDQFRSISSKLMKYHRMIQVFSGLLLVLMGVLMIAGRLKYLSGLFV